MTRADVTRPDLTVMGAGIFGLACAWEAARRGARVRLVEVARVGAGSSGGIVGALAPHVPENWNEKKAFQLEGLLMAEGFWTGVRAASGCDPGYARTGRLQPLADAQAVALAQARGQNAETLWQGRAAWQVVATTGAPWEPASPTGLLVADTLSARLHPRLASVALVATLAARGVQIEYAHTEPEGPTIWATGYAGLLALNADLGQNLGAGVKGQAALLRHEAGDLAQLFVDGLHVVPHADGTVAIGSTSENHFDEPNGVDAQCDDLIARARSQVPALARAEVLERWAGVRPRARSRAPMLGAWPRRKGWFVANGGFKIGFGIAPKVAQVMIDLVLEGQDRIPESFRPEASLRR
jgi:glycine oxidase